MVAVSVVMIIQVVGLILVIALLSIPPYLAGQRARSLFSMMLMASLWSMVFCTSGLILSYQFDLTTGATIIAVATVTFFIVLAGRALWSK
jgi:zinc transport system permease protein